MPCVICGSVSKAEVLSIALHVQASQRTCIDFVQHAGILCWRRKQLAGMSLLWRVQRCWLQRSRAMVTSGELKQGVDLALVQQNGQHSQPNQWFSCMVMLWRILCALILRFYA